MSSAPAPTEQPPDGDVPAPKKGIAALLPAILALVAGLAVGGGAGVFAVGPALASGIAPSGPGARPSTAAHADGEAGDEHADGDEGEEDKEAKEGEHGKEGEASSTVFTIDNLVLNPAESGGTRFLLLTISFDMQNQAALDAIKARDAEMRDVVLATLGRRTVEELSTMSLRDSLKLELKDVARKQLGRKIVVRRVYFPQFVIQ
jgi:flagellar FliL protein